MKKNFFLLFFLLPYLCIAQMLVSGVPMSLPNSPLSYKAMVENTFGGMGQLSNIQVTGDTTALQAGWFRAFGTNLGMSSGMLITNGDINGAVGPNSNTSYTGNVMNLPGDADLTVVSGVATFDAFIIEFDIIPDSNFISLQYVFASDEYVEFAQTGGPGGINDAMAFMITGTNPAGGNYSNYNFALVPNTNLPVSINNINCDMNSQYFVCNDQYSLGGFGSVTCDSTSGCPTNNLNTSIEYDGFTTPLDAVVSVVPNQSYHLKLVIADGSDHILDSGLFFRKSGAACGNASIAPDFTAINSACFVNFTNTSANATQYYWDLGDGTTSGANSVAHIYQTGGQKNVCLYVANSNCDTFICKSITPPQTYFAFTPTITGSQVVFNNFSDTTLQYSWNFGDGTTDTAFSPTHIYCTTGIHAVCLYANGICSNSLCQYIDITGPFAHFTHTISGYTVSFTNTSIPAASYLWDFGDGTTDTNFSPTHAYPSIGNKYVCLSAIDSCMTNQYCYTLYVTGTQALDNEAKAMIKYYPNPTENVLYMELKNEQDDKAKLSLLNLLGQVVWEKNLFSINGKISETIDFQHFPKGIYFLFCQTETQQYIEKIVKE